MQDQALRELSKLALEDPHHLQGRPIPLELPVGLPGQSRAGYWELIYIIIYMLVYCTCRWTRFKVNQESFNKSFSKCWMVDSQEGGIVKVRCSFKYQYNCGSSASHHTSSRVISSKISRSVLAVATSLLFLRSIGIGSPLIKDASALPNFFG